MMAVNEKHFMHEDMEWGMSTRKDLLLKLLENACDELYII